MGVDGEAEVLTARPKFCRPCRPLLGPARANAFPPCRASWRSLKALREAGTTSYYKDKGSLWVKVVSTGDTGPITGAGLQVSR
jgi:hypothetical protein